MQRVKAACSVTVQIDGWTEDQSHGRQLGFLFRCSILNSLTIEEYLVDLVPVLGRENAKTLVILFRRTMLWFGLATVNKRSEDWRLIDNPHLGDKVFVPASSWEMPTSESELELAFPGFQLSGKIIGTGSDNAEVMIKANQLLGTMRQACTNHGVHNVVIPALNSSLFYRTAWHRIDDLAYRVNRFPLLADILHDVTVLLGEYYASWIRMNETRWMGFPTQAKRTLQLWLSLQRLEDLLLAKPKAFPKHYDSIKGDTKIFTEENKKALQQILRILEPLRSLNDAYTGIGVAPIDIFNANYKNCIAFHMVYWRVLEAYIETPITNGCLPMAPDFGIRVLDLMTTKLLAPMSAYLSSPSVSNLHPATITTAFDPDQAEKFVKNFGKYDPIFRAVFKPGVLVPPQYDHVTIPAVNLRNDKFPSQSDFETAISTVLGNASASPPSPSDTSSGARLRSNDSVFNIELLLTAASMDPDDEPSTTRPTPKAAWASFHPTLAQHLRSPSTLPAVLDTGVNQKESLDYEADLDYVNTDASFLQTFSSIVYIGGWYLLAGFSEENLKTQHLAFVKRMDLQTRDLSVPESATDPSTNLSSPSLATSDSSMSPAKLMSYTMEPTNSSSRPRVHFADDDTDDPHSTFASIKLAERSSDQLEQYNHFRRQSPTLAYAYWAIRAFSPTSKRVEEAFSTAGQVTDPNQSRLLDTKRTMQTVLANTFRRTPLETLAVDIFRWGVTPTEKMATQLAADPDTPVDLDKALAQSSPNPLSKQAKANGTSPQLTSFPPSNSIRDAAGAAKRLYWTNGPSHDSDDDSERPTNSPAAATLSYSENKVFVNAKKRRCQEAEQERKRMETPPANLSKTRQTAWSALNPLYTVMGKKQTVPKDFHAQFSQALVSANVDKSVASSLGKVAKNLLPSPPSSRHHLVYIHFMDQLLTCVEDDVPWKNICKVVQTAMECYTPPKPAPAPREPRKRGRSASNSSLDTLSPAPKRNVGLSTDSVQQIPSQPALAQQLDKLMRDGSSKAKFLLSLSSSLAAVPSSKEMATFASTLQEDQIGYVLQELKKSLDENILPKDLFFICLVHLRNHFKPSSHADSSSDIGDSDGMDMDCDSDASGQNEDEQMDFSDEECEMASKSVDSGDEDLGNGDSGSDNEGSDDEVVDDAEYVGIAEAIQESKRTAELEKLNWDTEIAMLKSTIDLATHVLANPEGDGNCMYHTIRFECHRLGHHPKLMPHAQLRKNINTYMEQQRPSWFKTLQRQVKRSTRVGGQQIDEWVTLTLEEAKTAYLAE